MNTEYPISDQGRRHQLDILKRKQEELCKHIDDYFQTCGLEHPCVVLQEMLLDSMTYLDVHPNGKYSHQYAVDRAVGAMAIMSFLSVLYERFAELKEVEAKLMASG